MNDKLQILDPRAVRDLRQRRGLTESYLGALCGVTSTVIRGLERGGPQEDLSLRFVTRLADELGVPVHALLAHEYRPEPDPAEPAADDARTLGALLFAIADRIPADAICDVLGWAYCRLEDAEEALAARLETAGGTLIDSDGWLSLGDDVSPVDRETLAAASAAAFARRRPTLLELRVVVKAVKGEITRLEHSNTTLGITVGRLRAVGVLANADAPRSDKSDPPILSDAVRYSLLLDDPDVQAAIDHPEGNP